MQVFKSLSDPAVAQALTRGSVGVIPTDTVYGLVCLAANEQSVARLYALKRRERKPGTLIAANTDQLIELGIKKRYLTAVDRFWPGSVSIIIPTPELSYLRQDVSGLAVRVPGMELVSELLSKTGPLITTSANQPGEPTSSNVAEAQVYFGDAVDFYVDGGDLSGLPPSTLIRIIDDSIEVLRQGAVNIDETGKVVNS
jgi:L-threonylcarbamoyladenylate synthase